MKGYCKGCGEVIDETEITTHKCKMFDFTPKYDNIRHDGMITRRRKTN